MLRYVILEHHWYGIHYDLMLEHQHVLQTWRLETPLTVGNMPAVLLPDHRLEYLTYEGPISGNRGNVRRVAEGTYTQLAGPLNQYVLSGTNNGLLRIEQLNGENWQMTWTPVDQASVSR